MSHPLIRIHNMATGEIVDREMTQAEHAKYISDNNAAAALQAAADAKAAALASARAKLAALGLTDAEVAALFGG